MTKQQMKMWALEHDDPVEVIESVYKMRPSLRNELPSKEEIKEILTDLLVEEVLLGVEHKH